MSSHTPKLPDLSLVSYNAYMRYFQNKILPSDKDVLPFWVIYVPVYLNSCYNCGEKTFDKVPPLDNRLVLCERCFYGLFPAGIICNQCNKSTLNIGFESLHSSCESPTTSKDS